VLSTLYRLLYGFSRGESWPLEMSEIGDVQIGVEDAELSWRWVFMT
jgi:hypothetical protein